MKVKQRKNILSIQREMYLEERTLVILYFFSKNKTNKAPKKEKSSHSILDVVVIIKTAIGKTKKDKSNSIF